jgi:hypothetical protein
MRSQGFTDGFTPEAGGSRKICLRPVHNEITETWNTDDSGVLWFISLRLHCRSPVDNALVQSGRGVSSSSVRKHYTWTNMNLRMSQHSHVKYLLLTRILYTLIGILNNTEIIYVPKFWWTEFLVTVLTKLSGNSHRNSLCKTFDKKPRWHRDAWLTCIVTPPSNFQKS